MKDQDSIFFRNFSLLVGGLFLLTIILGFVGYVRNAEISEGKEQAVDRSHIAETLKSVAKVNTGEVIVAQVAAVDETPKAAFDGSTDGKMIYENVCSACHGTGAAGAPKLEASAWENRLTQGIDGLVKSATTGKGAMPPRGGRADLNDEQIKATIEFMTSGF